MIITGFYLVLAAGTWLLALWMWWRYREISRLLENARAISAVAERGLETVGTEARRSAAQLDRLETDAAEALTAGLLDDDALGGRALAALAEADEPMTMEDLAERLDTSVGALGLALAKLYRGGAITLTTTATISVTTLDSSPKGRQAIDQVARLLRAHVTGRADA
jgi:DNA-binding transcriptional ArsR family regulator